MDNESKSLIDEYVLLNHPLVYKSINVESMVYHNNILRTKLNTGKVLKTDFTSLIDLNKSALEVYIRHNYLKLNNSVIKVEVSYDIKNIYDTYTILDEDLTGKCIIRVNGLESYNVNIPLLSSEKSEDFMGKTLTIRSNTDSIINIIANSDVIINALDTLVLRRKASSISLVYIGNQEWDVFGEIP